MSINYCTRCKHIPLFTHGIVRAQSECPASRQVGSYIWGVPTVSSSAIDSTYARGARYSYVNRVLLPFKLIQVRMFGYLF